MNEDNPKVYGVKLPFTFEVKLSSATSCPNTITVLLKLDGVLVEKLPDHFHNNQLIFKLQDNVYELLRSFVSEFFYVKIQERITDKDWKIGIIYSILDNYYGIIRIPKDIKSNDIDSKIRRTISNYRDKEDHISNWIYKSLQVDNSEIKRPMLDNFTMKPPSGTVVSNKGEDNTLDYSPQSQTDPLRFLYSRYYSILYSLTTPLSYFPKTTISRFRNLCGNDNLTAKENLLNIYLSISELDERHNGKYGILKTIDIDKLETSELNVKNKYESQSQKEFLIRNHDLMVKLTKSEKSRNNTTNNRSNDNQAKRGDSSDDNILSFVLELKAREAQLQILVLLELLDSWQILENEFLTTNSKRQEKEEKQKKKQKKQSLVRKKSITSKKIVPTFLGMGVNLQDKHTGSQPVSTEIDEFVLYETLNTLIDRMGLWDTLLDRSTRDKDDSSLGFLAYVLIPYFKQRLPLTLKYIIERVKGLNLKLNAKPNKQSSQKQPKLNESGTENSKTNTHTTRPSEFAKIPIDPKQVPFLKKSFSTITTKNDLLPAFSLKRSKSTLASKNLQKRQVDMSLNLKSYSESHRDIIDNSSTLSRSTSEKSDPGNKKQIIFGNAKKFKSQPDIALKTSNGTFAQVEATPSKKNPEVYITEISSNITSPTNPKQHQRNEVAKTPVNQFIRPTVGASYKETTIPCSNIKDKPSLSDRLMKESLTPPPNLTINSSPKNAIEMSNSGGLASELIASSPFDSIVSPVHIRLSPFQTDAATRRKKRKPGEPISFVDSGFFDTNLNGSPPSALNKADEKDSTSIFKRSGLKRKKIVSLNAKPNGVLDSKMININKQERTDDDDDDDNMDSDFERLIKPLNSSYGGQGTQKAFKTYKRSK